MVLHGYHLICCLHLFQFKCSFSFTYMRDYFFVLREVIEDISNTEQQVRNYKARLIVWYCKRNFYLLVLCWCDFLTMSGQPLQFFIARKRINVIFKCEMILNCFHFCNEPHLQSLFEVRAQWQCTLDILVTIFHRFLQQDKYRKKKIPFARTFCNVCLLVCITYLGLRMNLKLK